MTNNRPADENTAALAHIAAAVAETSCSFQYTFAAASMLTASTATAPMRTRSAPQTTGAADALVPAATRAHGLGCRPAGAARDGGGVGGVRHGAAQQVRGAELVPYLRLELGQRGVERGRSHGGFVAGEGTWEGGGAVESPLLLPVFAWWVDEWQDW